MRQIIWALWASSRPLQLLAVLGVAYTGMIIAYVRADTFSLSGLIGASLALVGVALSIHHANEYADIETDRLTERTKFSGGSGALVNVPQARQYLPYAMTTEALLGITCGVIAGLPTVALVILLIGTIGGWMYSLPPLQLAWRGWGELTNALLGGTLLMSFGYSVQTGTIDTFIVVVSVPFTLLNFNNLLATQYADKDADVQVGKYSLATRYDLGWLSALYIMGLLVSSGLWIYLTNRLLPWQLLMFFVPVVGLGILGARDYYRGRAPHFSVYAMVTMLVGQLVGWGMVAITIPV